MEEVMKKNLTIHITALILLATPDERSGGMSGFRVSSPNQTTAKIRYVADFGSANLIDVTSHFAN
jgi:hypothetical protein